MFVGLGTFYLKPKKLFEALDEATALSNKLKNTGLDLRKIKKFRKATLKLNQLIGLERAIKKELERKRHIRLMQNGLREIYAPIYQAEKQKERDVEKNNKDLEREEEYRKRGLLHLIAK